MLTSYRKCILSRTKHIFKNVPFVRNSKKKKSSIIQVYRGLRADTNMYVKGHYWPIHRSGSSFVFLDITFKQFFGHSSEVANNIASNFFLKLLPFKSLMSDSDEEVDVLLSLDTGEYCLFSIDDTSIAHLSSAALEYAGRGDRDWQIIFFCSYSLFIKY